MVKNERREEGIYTERPCAASHQEVLVLRNFTVQNFNMVVLSGTSTSVKQTCCYSVHLLITGISVGMNVGCCNCMLARAIAAAAVWFT